MDIARRTLIGGLVGAAALRAVLLAIYAAGAVVSPFPAFHLEGANVHLAWRAEQGLPLYPDGGQYPFTLNYMGPVYYTVVGWLGRCGNADIRGLSLIGRVLTVASGLLLAGLVYGYLARRLGRPAAVVGGLLTLGAGPMIGFGAMVRPDATADALGLSGFWLACGSSGLSLWGGAALLALACMTKQTAAIYVVAAAAVLLITRPREKRRVLGLAVVGGGVIVAIALACGLTREPHMLAGLLGQTRIAFSPRQLASMLVLVNERSPELLWFAVIGLGLWTTPRWREWVLVVLTAAVLVGVLATAGKRGSDLNYFLSLRAVAAMGAATLCAAAWQGAMEARRAVLVLAASLLVCMPSLLIVGRAARSEIETARQLRLPAGRMQLAAFREAIQLAGNPHGSVLTDNDALAVYQGTDVPLLDTFLFRLRVEAGEIDPAPLIERIQDRRFSTLILTADPEGEYPEPFFWRLPRPVAEAITAHYALQRRLGPWLVFEPRPASGAVAEARRRVAD